MKFLLTITCFSLVLASQLQGVESKNIHLTTHKTLGKIKNPFDPARKQKKWWRCNKCGRYHKEEPKTCGGCGHDTFFIVYQ